MNKLTNIKIYHFSNKVGRYQIENSNKIRFNDIGVLNTETNKAILFNIEVDIEAQHFLIVFESDSYEYEIKDDIISLTSPIENDLTTSLLSLIKSASLDLFKHCHVKKHLLRELDIEESLFNMLLSNDREVITMGLDLLLSNEQCTTLSLVKTMLDNQSNELKKEREEF